MPAEIGLDLRLCQPGDGGADEELTLARPNGCRYN
jgi:hypothetical protein